MRNHTPNNILHLATLIFIVIATVALTSVIIKANRQNGFGTHQSTQLRGIHQGIVSYANTNGRWYPGINRNGQTTGLDVATRFHAMLEAELFPPEYLISPSERDPTIQEWDHQNAFGDRHYSFALLQIPEEGGRRNEWRQTLNPAAAILSDRNTGTAHSPSSTHATEPGTSWRGYILFNDNHAVFESEHIVETTYDGFINTGDSLFSSSSDHDALLVHSKN